METPSDKFIGNSTLLDTLLSNYTKLFMDYSGTEPKVNVTKDEYDSLGEIQRRLTGDAISISSGLEAIGNFLAVADFENKGVDQSQFENLGWLVAYLGKSMNAHIHQLDCISCDLKHSVIQD